MSIFRVEPQAGGVVHLVVDDPARRVNVLDEAAIADLERALDELTARDGTRGVVVRSGKPGSFIAGADLEAIGRITDREEALALIRRVHAAFGRLAALPVPTVTAIDGVCLGGGAELALACDSRIASNEPRTQIGFPEVLLGIYPGFGGTVRLPRLVGLSTALDLILTGRALDARRAEKAGLIARAVPAAWLLDRAHERIAALAARPPGRRRDFYRPRGFGAQLIDGTPFGRALAFSKARASVRARTGGHYPAPIAALDVLAHTLGKRDAEALPIEASRVADLLTGPVCKNLVRIFQLSEQAKKDPPVSDPTAKAAPVREMLLIGAGIMGGGIAEITTRSGVTVRMRDLKPEALTHALQTVRRLVSERSRKRRGSARDLDAQMARLFPTFDLAGAGRADLAIEAVVEDLEIKRRVFAELEVRMAPGALLATNTSSLSVDALAAGLRQPERMVGLHFFNPVHRMPLIEIVRGARTSDAALVTAVAFARKLGKTPVVVRDAPGFVVNRVLMPYLREAMHLLEEGFTIREIDASMRRFGMPMGPFEVLDEVGLDVALKVAGVLTRAFPDRMTGAPALEKLTGAGRLGRKSGVGFYRYRGGKRTVDPGLRGLLGIGRERRAPSLDALAERMTFAMVNESVRCLEDGVAASAGEVDLAMVFGTGFPPFRGGPLRYADTVGLTKVHSRLVALYADKGERFKPAALLVKKTEEGGTFTHPLTFPAGSPSAPK